ncbi:hypothetical protein CSUI_008442 [Cystoisospora suis]|uniref:Uncharacterized protein n=1 Tax=Cystoisospora suis TaxID=483139 RepID=A0A2C6KKR5_9APIC|nr:hypothetical protein CSUI_008442 [Cystoisospora suis]
MGPRRPDPNKTGACPYCTLKMYCRQHKDRKPENGRSDAPQLKDAAGTITRMYDQIISSKLMKFREKFSAELEKHAETMWGSDPLQQLKDMQTLSPEVKSKKVKKKRKKDKRKKKSKKKSSKKKKKSKAKDSSSSSSSSSESDSSSSESSSDSEQDRRRSSKKRRRVSTDEGQKKRRVEHLVD